MTARGAVLSAIVALGIIALVPATLAGVPAIGWGFPASFTVSGIAVALLGGLIERSRPGHPVGRLFILGGLVSVVYQLVMDVLFVADVPGRAVLWTVMGYALWILPLAIWFTGLGLFPAGRWAFRAAPVIVGLGCWATTAALVAIALTLPPQAPEELPSPWLATGPTTLTTELGAGAAALFQFTPLALAVGHATLFRRSGPVLRRQIGLVVGAISVLGITAILSQLFSGNDPASVFAVAEMASLLGIFAAIAIAITRYRLYDIDRIVSRTVGWAMVTATLVIVFVVLVVGLQALLASATQGQTVAVAVSTLVAAALFEPVRSRIQGAVDRRFDRARYDGALVVGTFNARLRDEVDLDSLEREIGGAVALSVRPSGVSVWLRPRTATSERRPT